MERRTIILGILACIVAVVAVMPSGHAESATTVPTMKVGVVSLRGVFAGSKRYLQRQSQSAQRAAQAKAQLAELMKQADAEENELTTLKQGTTDYLKQLQVVLEARSKMQNQQELSKQQRMTEDKRSFEEVYEEILKAIEAVAKEKGLDLVLERTEPKFPMSPEEVSPSVSTQKVLYVANAVDLTNEVIARVDAGVNPKP